uniref:hypothetical protein n=1 Tax=Xanthomonas albilineans TaxID=29447 RepID=UPI0027D9934D|nr:hypothetical protein [Xanthomonas albilineans]
MPVEAVQAFLGGDPQESLIVALQTIDRQLRQALVQTEVLQAAVRRRVASQGWDRCQEQS